ncbi:MAG: VWA domain-containing protein [Planctomycetes bacterium]|nr:VWA domain-containing protein [Planctomycetota bacterium]
MASDQSASDSADLPLPPPGDADLVAPPSTASAPPPLPSREVEPTANDDPATPPAQDESETQPSTPDGRSRRGLSSALEFTLALLASALFHMALMVVAGLWMMEPPRRDDLGSLVLSHVVPPEKQEDIFPERLDEQLDPAKELIFDVAASGDEPGESAIAPPPMAPAREETSDEEEQRVAATGPPLPLVIPRFDQPRIELPLETIGEQRAVVDGYTEALGRITQEVLTLLEKEKVLLVWCFDQSESMKDDQQEIRDEISRVYEELGLADSAAGGALTNAVTSYGANFLVHTPKPTSQADKIREAINAVPIDPSGREIMLQAVSRSIAEYQTYAKRTRRRMALVLVTDESGDFNENYRFLENVIKQAQDARCMVYVLGREAVFSYPYAHMRWKHPQTHHVHWLRIDRGPESAFVEQLQTNGFHRRYDADASGFGPYDQSRLAKQTGGIFFLLPSIETNLVRGKNRRYELEAMRLYAPDMRSREAYLLDRNKSEFRQVLWKVITDLNPYHPEAAKIINMRVHFSPQAAPFLKQADHEQKKAVVYLKYMAQAIEAIEAIKPLREREYSPRWQANYDLLYAQLLAYTARIYEYGAYLEHFKRNPKIAPPRKKPNLLLIRWDIHTRKETITGETIKPYVEKSTALLKQIIKQHAGTPWAARAKHELNRGFGVKLFPYYRRPTPTIVGKLVPVPKL